MDEHSAPPDSGSATPADSEQRLAEERAQLFSEAAHEFRTPLAIISCNAELIGEGLIQGDEAQQAARVIMETVRQTDERLTELLEDARQRVTPPRE